MHVVTVAPSPACTSNSVAARWAEARPPAADAPVALAPILVVCLYRKRQTTIDRGPGKGRAGTGAPSRRRPRTHDNATKPRRATPQSAQRKRGSQPIGYRAGGRLVYARSACSLRQARRWRPRQIPNRRQRQQATPHGNSDEHPQQGQQQQTKHKKRQSAVTASK